MKFKFITAVTMAWLLTASFNANAAMISLDLSTPGDGLVTLDTSTGTLWLDLSLTGNMSFDDARAAYPAWQPASAAQIRNLFSTMFPGYVDTETVHHFATSSDLTSALVAQSVNFINFFGMSRVGDPSSKGQGKDDFSFGFFEGEMGILRGMGVWSHNTHGAGIYSDHFTQNYDYYRSSTYILAGTYLVQPGPKCLKKLFGGSPLKYFDTRQNITISK